MAVGATKAVARPKRGAAEGSTVPKSRLIKEEKKRSHIGRRASQFSGGARFFLFEPVAYLHPIFRFFQPCVCQSCYDAWVWMVTISLR
jgi:hypothetical protein